MRSANEAALLLPPIVPGAPESMIGLELVGAVTDSPRGKPAVQIRLRFNHPHLRLHQHYHPFPG